MAKKPKVNLGDAKEIRLAKLKIIKTNMGFALQGCHNISSLNVLLQREDIVHLECLIGSITRNQWLLQIEMNTLEVQLREDDPDK